MQAKRKIYWGQGLSVLGLYWWIFGTLGAVVGMVATEKRGEFGQILFEGWYLVFGAIFGINILAIILLIVGFTVYQIWDAFTKDDSGGGM